MADDVALYSQLRWYSDKGWHAGILGFSHTPGEDLALLFSVKLWQERKRFGLLEKRKDYVEHAKAFHKKEEAIRANKYTPEELMLMKTQDIGYILQKLQSEKNKIQKLIAMLHSLDNQSSNRHIYFAEDWEDAKEVQSRSSKGRMLPASDDIPEHIKRKTASSYRELEPRRSRVGDLEKIYMDMTMQKELQKKGRKRKLREDEIVNPTSKPVYKWWTERKR
nr:probable U3 small nucleolar RNA-associated protein 11 [Ziziphus jujuba var. spinosa]